MTRLRAHAAREMGRRLRASPPRHPLQITKRDGISAGFGFAKSCAVILGAFLVLVASPELSPSVKAQGHLEYVLPPSMSPGAESRGALWALSKNPSKISSRLTEHIQGRKKAQDSIFNRTPGDRGQRFAEPGADNNDTIQLYVWVTEVSPDVLSLLFQAGGRIGLYDEGQGIVSLTADADALPALSAFPFVKRVDLPLRGHRNAGTVATQGDAILNADRVRALGHRGAGVKIGVISDGISNLTGRIASGDLPSIGIVAPSSSLSSGGSVDDPLPGGNTFTATPAGRPDLTDGSEGTAMLEIVHDLAPDARLYFAGISDSLTFRRAIKWMVAMGVNVIVNDIGFFSGGPFDGTSAISVEAENATLSGVSFFTAAGNHAQVHYEAAFNDPDSDGWHNFFSTDEAMKIEIPALTTIQVALQWNDTWGSSGNDYNLYLLSDELAVLSSSLDTQDGDDDPSERIQYTNFSFSPIFAHIAIRKIGAAATRTLEIFILGGVTIEEYGTASGSIPIPADAKGAVVSVGAANSGTPNSIASYSSRGPTNDGRAKPDLIAIDGVATTTPGFATFYGTSAAAPHAAGVAALLLSADPALTPAEVKAILQNAAVDLGDSGMDNTYGAGRIDALAALSLPAKLTSHSSGAQLAGSTATFRWSPPGNTSVYYLKIGSAAEKEDIYEGYQGSSLQATVVGLPLDERTLHLTLYTLVGRVWMKKAYTLVAARAPKASFTSHSEGQTLSGSSATFQWGAVSGSEGYYLKIGSAPEREDIYEGYQGASLQVTVNGLPTDGRTLYATLYDFINGSWVKNQYTFRAVDGRAQITSPWPGSTLSSSTATFRWTAPVPSYYYLKIGNAFESEDIYEGYQGSGLSATVSGLPADGRTLHVTLYTLIGGRWVRDAWTFRAMDGRARISSPSPGSRLSSSSAAFQWSAAAPSVYYLKIGSSLEKEDIYEEYKGSNLSAAVNGLPTDGRALFVTLYTLINNAWSKIGYVFHAFAPDGRAYLTSPSPGATLSSSSATFQWSAATPSVYYLKIGSTLEGEDINEGYQGSGLSATVTGLPTDGRTLYVTLYTLVNNAWVKNQYTLKAAE